VSNVAKVTRAVVCEYLEQLIRSGGACEPDHGGIRGGLVPIIHCPAKRLERTMARWDRRFVHRRHRPVALLHIGRLRGFELIDRPENRQPAIRIRRGQAGQMRGIHDQHRVEFETHRTRLNVAHARELQRGENFPITQSAFDARGDFLEHAFARRRFEQPHQRLDFRMQLNCSRIQLYFLGRNRRKLREKSKIANCSESAGTGAGLEKGAARNHRAFR
jgi:hypothetical protein